MAQPKEGLTASFPFNDGSLKNEVNGKSAKTYGSSWTEDRFGNENSALFLHGNFGSFINLGTGNELKPRVGAISLWFVVDYPEPKGNIGVTYNPIIITSAHNRLDFNEAFFAGLNINTKSVDCNVSRSEEQQVSIYSLTQITLKKWHHLVLTYDDKVAAFYLDGRLENQISKNFETIFLEGDSVLLGTRNTEKNKAVFTGRMDDVRFYDHVVNASEVRALYNAPNPKQGVVIRNYILLAFTIILVIAAIFYSIRWRIRVAIKKEREKNELTNRWYEQEIRVLSAQMDPHFIFNSLNSILQLIIAGQNDNAQAYLSKFSKLMRKILENNLTERVLLSDEIEIFQKYLEIESLRFNNAFKFEISVEKDIVPTAVSIPHFLIHPLIENAVWHGLLPKDGERLLEIKISRGTPGLLVCVVKDNGVGRGINTNKEKDDKRSLAINFIQQRLFLLSKLHNVDCKLIIEDLRDASGSATGTNVEIRIPLFEKHEKSNNN